MSNQVSLVECARPSLKLAAFSLAAGTAVHMLFSAESLAKCAEKAFSTYTNSPEINLVATFFMGNIIVHKTHLCDGMNETGKRVAVLFISACMDALFFPSGITFSEYAIKGLATFIIGTFICLDFYAKPSIDPERVESIDVRSIDEQADCCRVM